MFNYSQKLVQIMQNEFKDEKALLTTLSVLKCGVLSKNIDVTIICVRLLNKICSIIYEQSSTINNMKGDLLSRFWDWFVKDNIRPFPILLKQDSKTKLQKINKKQTKDIQKQSELEVMIGESGLKGLIRAL